MTDQQPGQVGGVTVAVSFTDASKGARGLIDSKMDDKQDPREVGYRAAEQPDQVCRLCGSWEGTDQDTESTCKKVGGPIDAGGTCDEFAAAKGDKPDTDPAEPGDQPAEETVPPSGGDDEEREHP